MSTTRHIGNIMLNIKTMYANYTKNKARKVLRDNLKYLEESHTKANTWNASLKLNHQLLSILSVDLLKVSGDAYSTITIHTGFSNAEHLFNWTDAVQSLLKNREPIGFEITNIMYQRKSMALTDFLTTSQGRRYPVDAFYINLLTELSSILYYFDDIKDPAYADRSSAALYQSWVDIFAIVEMLCILGANDE